MISRTTRSRANESLVNAVRSRLEQSLSFRGRSQLIQVDECDGTIVLHGRLPSYYLKQLLQTALRDLDGVVEIDNQVEVLWPGDASPSLS